MKAFYEMKLNSEYVLSLFQEAVDKCAEFAGLGLYTNIIMDWYEEQLENNELDWDFSIPSLVYCDLVVDKMVCITVHNPLFNIVDTLYLENGIGSVDGENDAEIVRICYKSKDNDGNVCYLCQKDL